MYIYRAIVHANIFRAFGVVGGKPKIVAKRDPWVSNSACESIFQMNVDFHFTTWKLDSLNISEYLRISGEMWYPNGPIGYWKKVTILKEACIVHVEAVIHDYQGQGASWSKKCHSWKDCPGDLTSSNTDNVNFCTRICPYQREASRPSGPSRFFLDFSSLPPTPQPSAMCTNLQAYRLTVKF